MSLKAFALALCLSFACIPSLFAGGPVVLDFSDQATLETIVTKGSRPSLVTNESGPALRVEAKVGEEWPGLNFPMPKSLDLSRHGYLTFTVRNLQDKAIQVHCSIESETSGIIPTKKLTRTTHIGLKASETLDVRIPLIPFVDTRDLKRDDFFGMNGVPFINDKSLHLAHITKIGFFLIKPTTPDAFEIGSVVLDGAPLKADAVPEKVFPMIDEFGQFKHREWPGKTHSITEMQARRADEAKQLASSQPPASWDRFGGWRDGPQLEATGWFRTAIRDMHVTLLNLLGLDDNKLTYYHAGRFKQLSQFGGQVIKELIA